MEVIGLCIFGSETISLKIRCGSIFQKARNKNVDYTNRERTNCITYIILSPTVARKFLRWNVNLRSSVANR